MNFHVETNRDRLCDTIWPDRPLDSDVVLTAFPVSSTLDLESLKTSLALQGVVAAQAARPVADRKKALDHVANLLKLFRAGWTLEMA